MKRIIAALILAWASVSAHGQGTERKPENLTMTLALIADAEESRQHILVINGVIAFGTVKGLKGYLRNLPKGSSLTWDPGCGRIGSEPIIGSKEELKKFTEFCKAIGISFVLVPSG
jgi:hypothetical protein